jgi:hypothetical protein
MPTLQTLTDFRFRSEPIELCILRLRVAAVAALVGASLEHWQEAGLGPKSGFAARLPSGRVVAFAEDAFLVADRATAGPTVFVEVSDVATEGVAALVDELLTALGCDRPALDWVQERTLEGYARARVAWLEVARAARARGEPVPVFDYDR